MASENAKAVARDMIKAVESGGKAVITKIAPKNGRYSKRTADSGKIQKTKSYQREMKPVIKQLEEERQRAITALKGKISKAKYRDLTDAVDKLTKNIQLLGGKPTEKISLISNVLDEIENGNTDTKRQTKIKQ